MSSDAGAVPPDKFLCGWRLRTGIAMPELAPWTGDDRQPDLLIHTGPIPSQLDDAHAVSPLLQVNDEGQARLSIDGVASYWLRSTREIVIDPQIDVDSPDVRTFLFGTILGLLCHRRGLFPLHASCVIVEGNAIAISGVSGAGKSTLAAALVRRGHRLVSDDICAIDAGAPGGPVVRPAFPRVKLWQDSLEAMGIAADGLHANRFGQNKYYLRFSDSTEFQMDPLRLKAVYLLNPLAAPIAGREEIERLPLMQAAVGLHEQVYRKRTALRWGRAADLFTAVGQIAGATDIHRLTRGPDLTGLDALVRRIEAHAAT